MSWDGYITSLCANDGIKYGLIMSADGNLWAKSPELYANVSGEDMTKELKKVVNVMVDSSTAMANGVYFNGIKHIYISSDDNTIQAKKGQEGFAVAKANTCILVGTYSNGHAPGNCRKAVEAMRDYLVSNSC